MFYEEPKETLFMHTCRDDMREKKAHLQLNTREW